MTPQQKQPATVSRPAASVIVVNWNGGQLLLDALTSLQREIERYGAASGRVVELLVVDNGSTDGSVDQAGAAFPGARFIRLPANLGFGAAVNAGIHGSDSEHVILVNNDATVHPGYLDALIATMDDHPDLGAACGLVLLDGLFAPGPTQGARTFVAHDGTLWHRDAAASPGTGTKLINSTGNILSASGNGSDRDWLQPYRPETTGDEVLTSPIDVFGFNGGSAILRRTALDEVGLFDASLFMYYEDTELSWRLRRAGWRIACAPAAVTDHQHAASSDGRSDFFTFHNVRNRLLVATMHGPASMVAQAWTRTAIRTIRRGERRATLRAMVSAILALPRAVRARRRMARDLRLGPRDLRSLIGQSTTSVLATSARR